MKNPKGEVCWSFTLKHKKLKALQIYDPIFCINWIICVTKNYSDFQEMASSGYNVELKDIVNKRTDGRCAFCLEEKNVGAFVFLWLNKFSYPEFSHEVLHGVARVLQYKGIDLDGSTDEVYAYYQEFIMKELNKLRR